MLLRFYDKVYFETQVHQVLENFPSIGSLIPDFNKREFRASTFFDNFDELTK